MVDHNALHDRVQSACQAGHYDDAATATIGGLGPEILGLLVKMTKDSDAASDIFSMFCEDLWKGLPRFRWEASLKNWSYRLAINAHRRYLRDPLRRKGQRLQTGEADQWPDKARTVTRNYMRTTIKDRFSSLRQHLTPQEQALMSLRLDRGMEWNEIALIMIEDDDPSRDDILKEAKKQRMRFSRLKQKLTELARKEGLLDSTD